MMSRKHAYLISLLILSVITVLATTSGIRYNWPDFVHDRYGLPLTWGVHTLITIHGPVDIWKVNMMNLVLDLIIWLGLIILSHIITERTLS